MSITTKGGDRGKTSLIGGTRVSKASLRVSCYGDVDELSACLGWTRAELKACLDRYNTGTNTCLDRNKNGISTCLDHSSAEQQATVVRATAANPGTEAFVHQEPSATSDTGASATSAIAPTWEQLDRDIVAIQGDLFALAADLATPQLDTPRIGASQIKRLEQGIATWSEVLPPQRCFILPGGSRLSATLHLARTVCRRAERQTVALSEAEDVDSQALIYLNRLSDWLFLAARWSNFALGVTEQAAR